jgi:SAM-dependent methyltransferase
MSNSGSRARNVARAVRRRYRDNGLWWTALHLAERSTARAHGFFERRAREIERRSGRPGTNSVDRNRDVWGGYDWSQRGDEWSASPEWRQGVIDEFVVPHVKPGATIVEIGPGAGRWTSDLIGRAGRLILVDITETTLNLCREQFGDAAEYVLGDGASLPGIGDESIQFIWSFDVFVHIAPAEQRAYLADFARVLETGGRAVVHHGGDGGQHGGWRSAMTADLFVSMCQEAGLTVLRQVDSWGPGGRFVPSVDGDVVTILEK